MIADEVQRKLWTWSMVGAVILGIIFMFWTMVLNRGTIIIHSKAPFTLTIQNLRTENCLTDDCSTVVAPEDYSITVAKTGYKSFSQAITVPIMGKYEQSVSLQFIPVISASQLPKTQIFPNDPHLTPAQIKQLGLTAQTQIFFNAPKNLICYISVNPANLRQELFLAAINADGSPGTPQLVTSFLRDIQNFVIAPNAAGDKVAVIDRAPDGATLYVVDRKAQNRTSLLNYPAIRDMRWIDGTNNFIFQARAAADGQELLYLYSWDDGKVMPLSLNTPLEDVAIIGTDRLLAVTNQQLPPDVTPDQLQGALVTLGENQSTLEVNDNPILNQQQADATTNADAAASLDATASLSSATATLSTSGSSTVTATPLYAFIDYSLVTNEARIITTIATDPFPAQVKASTDAKSLYFLQGGQVFELRLAE
jgi:hypothetical protein